MTQNGDISSVSEVAIAPIYRVNYSTIIIDLVPFDANRLWKFMSDLEEIVCISCMNDFKLRKYRMKWWEWKKKTYLIFF